MKGFKGIAALLFAAVSCNVPPSFDDSSIRNKVADNGMKLDADSLTIKDYKELQHFYGILPDLPADADSIEVNYYHDDFLGDYSVNILFTVPKPVVLPADTSFRVCRFRYKNFKAIQIDSTLPYCWCTYHKGQM